MAGAHQAKMAISSRNASSSLGKVRAKTSALKKLFCTAGQPGASGTRITMAASTSAVEVPATSAERRLTRRS